MFKTVVSRSWVRQIGERSYVHRQQVLNIGSRSRLGLGRVVSRSQQDCMQILYNQGKNYSADLFPIYSRPTYDLKDLLPIYMRPIHNLFAIFPRLIPDLLGLEKGLGKGVGEGRPLQFDGGRYVSLINWVSFREIFPGFGSCIGKCNAAMCAASVVTNWKMIVGTEIGQINTQCGQILTRSWIDRHQVGTRSRRS